MTLVLLCLALAAPAADASVVMLDEVLVTAERVPLRVRDVAASVSIVTEEDIERSGARTVTDALDHLPGVFVQRTGRFGRTDIDIRWVGNYHAADSSQMPIDPYYTVDLRVGARLLFSLRLNAAVENILDRRHVAFADLPGDGAGLYEQPGRAFTVGLSAGTP
ncbi:MAG TPA: TonB-dependent receptor [candidate division WOR-3 bacterium]|uniref:TonB-dependent receptor n=1 Tax=candidate division WOR-3 bacterium TaxID=2052148 RepID=A0A7V0T7G3_UNCW3|nr:TonB-dependent receptor [candidate division WOR-3 bacterium]